MLRKEPWPSPAIKIGMQGGAVVGAMSGIWIGGLSEVFRGEARLIGSGKKILVFALMNAFTGANVGGACGSFYDGCVISANKVNKDFQLGEKYMFIRKQLEDPAVKQGMAAGAGAGAVGGLGLGFLSDALLGTGTYVGTRSQIGRLMFFGLFAGTIAGGVAGKVLGKGVGFFKNAVAIPAEQAPKQPENNSAKKM